MATEPILLFIAHQAGVVDDSLELLVNARYKASGFHRKMLTYSQACTFLRSVDDKTIELIILDSVHPRFSRIEERLRTCIGSLPLLERRANEIRVRLKEQEEYSIPDVCTSPDGRERSGSEIASYLLARVRCDARGEYQEELKGKTSLFEMLCLRRN